MEDIKEKVNGLLKNMDEMESRLDKGFNKLQSFIDRLTRQAKFYRKKYERAITSLYGFDADLAKHIDNLKEEDL